MKLEISIEAEKEKGFSGCFDTYAKLHYERINNTSNDRYEIECIPRVFEKIL